MRRTQPVLWLMLLPPLTELSNYFGMYPGETSTGPVHYNLADPKASHVIGTTGTTDAGRWRIVDANHIRDSSFSNCLYRRAQ